MQRHAVLSAAHCAALRHAFPLRCWQELNETRAKLERARSDAEEFQRRFLQARRGASSFPPLPLAYCWLGGCVLVMSPRAAQPLSPSLCSAVARLRGGAKRRTAIAMLCHPPGPPAGAPGAAQGARAAAGAAGQHPGDLQVRALPRSVYNLIETLMPFTSQWALQASNIWNTLP